MKVKSLSLRNFRSFESLESLELDQINIFVGANNSGKSSLLKALHLLQAGHDMPYADVRANAGKATVIVKLEAVAGYFNIHKSAEPVEGDFVAEISSDDRRAGSLNKKFAGAITSQSQPAEIPSVDPHHFIVPYLSKRKTSAFQEDVRSQHAMQIQSTMGYLAAKLARIGNPDFPGNERYRNACKQILGFVVTAIPSENGQRPGTYLPDREVISIEQMGEGVPHIVALLADLAVSENKLFLVEEPENDLHPEALKALLELIVESSKSNQFVVSTHSNVVVRHLGAAEGSKLYSVSSEKGLLPTKSNVSLVAPTPSARIAVLRELGYSFSDFDLWDGWLILEESSAERLIRDYLIPWFAPKLTRVRTLAAGGVSEVEPAFNDFQRLVRYTHLEQAYAGAVWIRVDGDEVGKETVDRLRKSYQTWPQDRFATFSQAQFEHYYPSEFATRISDALAIPLRKARQQAKHALLEDVRSWLDADETRGKLALAQSAAEVIADLRTIEQALVGRTDTSPFAN